MIFSENNKADKDSFETLLRDMDSRLNEKARLNEEYFVKRNGAILESDVLDAINYCAKGTLFENTINLVSGQSFPDIIANKYYGIEVKSTIKNHWSSVGSSILESTRIPSVERIYLTFGKLGKPVKFLTRPYEACMSGVAVTHYPRYLIDMQTNRGETIFDKIGIAYDQLRKLDNPVEPIAKYYKRQLKSEERLWWANTEEESVSSPPSVRLWNNLDKSVKDELISVGYALFPNILGNAPDKYNRYAIWLTIDQGIVNPCVRDSFSAGGQITIKDIYGNNESVPASFGRIEKYHKLIERTILMESKAILESNWQCKIKEKPLIQWCKLVAYHYSQTKTGCYGKAARVLSAIFNVDIDDLNP